MDDYKNKYYLCEKKLKRYEKILKHSDKQQLIIHKLKDEIEEKEREIRELYEYNLKQELFAKFKIESLIRNDLEDKTKIIYKAADILNGDFYSIYKKNNKTYFILIDGQGHGVTPALTIFAVSASLNNRIKEIDNIYLLLEKIFKDISKFLAEDEQLSYIFLCINDNQLHYASGGMYPIYIQYNNEIIKLKANNLPFMKVSFTPKIDKINITNLEKILLYSDGLIEDLDENLLKFHPKKIIHNPKLIEELKIYIDSKKFDDDITLIFYENN